MYAKHCLCSLSLLVSFLVLLFLYSLVLLVLNCYATMLWWWNKVVYIIITGLLLVTMTVVGGNLPARNRSSRPIPVLAAAADNRTRVTIQRPNCCGSRLVQMRTYRRWRWFYIGPRWNKSYKMISAVFRRLLWLLIPRFKPLSFRTLQHVLHKTTLH